MKIFCAPASLLMLAAAVTAGPPETKKMPVTDTYHGVEVTDPYRWLEDSSDKEVQAWSEAQNAYARSILDSLPNVDDIRTRVTEILSAKTVSYGRPAFRGGQVFVEKYAPPKQQRFLVVLPSMDEPDKARVLVDPNEIDKAGTTAIDWFIPSPDGKLVAVSLSKGGSESGDVYVYDVATGKQVHEVIPRVNGGTAGGDLAWSPDGSGFFYTRYPRGDERPDEDKDFYQQAYYHELGKPTAEDRYEIGKDFPRIAEIQFDMDDASGRLLATVQNGDGGEFAHYFRTPDGQWQQFSRFGDEIVQAVFGPNDDFYLLTWRDTPRGKILHMPIAGLDVSKAKVVIDQGDDTIVSSFMESPSILPTKSKIYVEYQLGGPSEIRAFDLDGRPATAPEQLKVSSVGGLTRMGDDQLVFSNSSFIRPTAWYHFDPATNETRKTALATESPVDFSDMMVRREFAESRDGTKIPINIVIKRGTALNTTHPCVVTGYGGYGVSLEPRFRAVNRVLFDQGVIYVVANLRGGGEYGETWHEQGALIKKQNVFDDFAAVLQHLIDRKFTNRNRLAITGGSNGGLLMGALVVQHPALVRAAVSYVGIYDMLRVELSPNGAFNVTEFGTVKDEDQFKALYAYSPYHHVKDGTEYPPVLFMTGANDPRVDPMQSRKMAARLQEANAAPTPILLRTSDDSGHGGDTSLDERIAQTVDAYAFLLNELHVEYEPVKKDDAGD